MKKNLVGNLDKNQDINESQANVTNNKQERAAGKKAQGISEAAGKKASRITGKTAENAEASSNSKTNKRTAFSGNKEVSADAIGFKYSKDIAAGMGRFESKINTELVPNSDLLHVPSALAVAKMLANFDARLVDPIKVSERDGKLYQIDGTKTMAVLTELHQQKGVQTFPVMCRIYTGLTPEDEARIYATTDDFHDHLSMAYKIRALLIAKDLEIMDFIETTKASGFDIRPGNYKPHDGFVCAIVMAFRCYRKLGSKEYLRMLKILMRTWAGASWSVTRNMLGGMTLFMTENRVNMNTFAKVFEKVTYEDIWRRALKYPGQHRPGAFADTIADFYNGRVVKQENDDAGSDDDLPQDDVFPQAM